VPQQRVSLIRRRRIKLSALDEGWYGSCVTPLIFRAAQFFAGRIPKKRRRAILRLFGKFVRHQSLMIKEGTRSEMHVRTILWMTVSLSVLTATVKADPIVVLNGPDDFVASAF
jgi:hypothetical protein